MPTLPLFEMPATPDAWHQVRAPGGYEGWYFDAEDFSTGIRISGMIGAGCQFTGPYRKRYDQYRKRPTKNAPPLPNDFPCFKVTIFRNGQFWNSIESTPFDSLRTSSEKLSLGVGQTDLQSESGTFRLKFSNESSLSGELRFHPLNSSQFISTSFSNHHHWSISPLCEVEGKVTAFKEKLPFKGRGIFEHRFGTTPIAEDIKRGLTGQLLSAQRALVFRILQLRNTNETQADLIELQEAGATQLAMKGDVNWSFMRRYPRDAIFPSHLRLSNPRIDSTAIWYESNSSEIKLPSALCASLV